MSEVQTHFICQLVSEPIRIQIDVYIIDHTHIIHAFCQLALRLMPKLKLYFEIYNRIMSRSPRKRRKLHNGEKVEPNENTTQPNENTTQLAHHSYHNVGRKLW